MKKLIVSLALLLSFGLNYGMNSSKMKNNNNFIFEDLITSLNEINSINLIEVTLVSENVVGSMCENLAVAVGTAAIESGYSLHTSLKLTYDVKNACDILVGLAALMNEAQ
jgi:hypothetical protein